MPLLFILSEREGVDYSRSNCSSSGSFCLSQEVEHVSVFFRAGVLFCSVTVGKAFFCLLGVGIREG